MLAIKDDQYGQKTCLEMTKITMWDIYCLCAPKLTSVEIFNVGDSFYPDARGMYIK